MTRPASTIRVLTPDVANKIAAGEVVDRPASVLKELMENSIDAGASSVDVEIAAGGKKLVAVSDDGFGMGRDDAMLCLERHATSKIKSADDLDRIGTLGFRGEALAAIASVSRFRLVTRTGENEAGTELITTGGKIQDVREAGAPKGTRMEVRDLFFNLPARRKFLRGHETELGHVRDIFLLQALSHPDIAMGLVVDGREVYRLAGGTIEDRLRDLFGAPYLACLKKVEYSAGDISVKGYISLPSYSRGDRREQFIFINKRAAAAAVLHFALSDAYHTLLPADRYPAIFLFITMDPSLVDVNVHPAKKEVRFRQPSDVRDTIKAALLSTLSPREPESAAASGAETLEPAQPAKVSQQLLSIVDLPETRVFQYPGTPQRLGISPESGAAAAADSDKAAASISQAGQVQTSDDRKKSSAPWAWCRILGQIGGLYVLLETEDGYVIMDPHAAHERVMYERYMNEVLHGKVNAQNLLIPETVELIPKDAMVVRKHLEVLNEMGFSLSEFGGDTFVVDALPGHFSGISARLLIVEVAHSLEESGVRSGKGRWREESVAMAACKSAVKAWDRLSQAEIEQLVIDLARTEMPYTCPHGRPTLMFTPFHELNRKFGRE
jgi:DNA mismatch repair protein MutL